MSLKDILVHLDRSPKCGARLALAISLARQHGARLTGLYVIAHPHYQSQHESDLTEPAAAEKDFERETALSGIAANWLLVECAASGISETEMVIKHSYHMDLVVVGQSDCTSHGSELPPDLPECVARGAGCPVLIVPHSGRFEHVAQRIMVAWRAGRESARVVNDAMPLLESAQEVRVVEVVQAGDREQLTSGGEVSARLARRRVAATNEVIAAEIPIGDILINHAWEEGCDLLVLGAYTNTPRSTPSLGEVGEHVLRHMSVPVLISH